VRTQVLAALAAVSLGVSTAVLVPAGAARADRIDRSAPNEAVCRPKTARRGIAAAFNQFLAASSAADQIRFVDQGAKIQAAVDRSDQLTLASGRDQSGREQPPLQEVAANVTVTCTAKTTATFTYDLQIKRPSTGVTTPPLGLHQPGAAVLRRGTWYVGALTACAFLALNPDPANQAPVAACYQALGQPPPVPST
jgi:hypothetical protein